MHVKDLYEAKYVPQMQSSGKMEGCCEQHCKCQIHGRNQDQVFWKTATQQPPPLITLSIKNSDENIVYKDIETLSLMHSYRASDFSFDTFLGFHFNSVERTMGPGQMLHHLATPTDERGAKQKAFQWGRKSDFCFHFNFPSVYNREACVLLKAIEIMIKKLWKK